MAAKSLRRALFIVNPNARNGRKSVATVRQLLEAGGLTLVDAAPAQGESLSDVIRRMSKACDLVIVGGGDGTLNSAAAGLVETGLPLGSFRWARPMISHGRSAFRRTRTKPPS